MALPFKASLRLALIMLFIRATKTNGNFAYLFGYGSLMLTLARTATAPDPDGTVYIPVKIRGIERLWNLWSERSQHRTLGVEPGNTPDAYVNGLIFAVKKEQLAAFDQREGPTYRRIRIPIEKVTFYRDNHRDQVIQEGSSTDIFMYSPRKESNFYFDKGHKQKKIALSYLNVVRTGSVEIDRKHQLNSFFINDCVQTMGLDGYFIEDDLSQPRYPRYPDKLLQEATASGNTKREKELKMFIEHEWADYMATVKEKWIQ